MNSGSQLGELSFGHSRLGASQTSELPVGLMLTPPESAQESTGRGWLCPEVLLAASFLLCMQMPPPPVCQASPTPGPWAFGELCGQSRGEEEEMMES